MMYSDRQENKNIVTFSFSSVDHKGKNQKRKEFYFKILRVFEYTSKSSRLSIHHVHHSFGGPVVSSRRDVHPKELLGPFRERVTVKERIRISLYHLKPGTVN